MFYVLFQIFMRFVYNRPQNAQKKEAATENPPVEKGTDDIRKYKELLDSGIITQEEFDVKKKQLLGL